MMHCMYIKVKVIYLITVMTERLTLTFQINESEWKLSSPKFKTSTFMHMYI